MLSNLTWWQFFGFYCLFLLLYYPLIITIYFRPQVSRLLRRSIIPPVQSVVLQPSSELTIANEPASSDSNIDFTINELIKSLKSEIVNGIKSAKDTRASRDQLLSLLKSILAKYPELKTFGQQVQIHEFIIQQAGVEQYPIQMAQLYALWPLASVQA